MICKNCGNANAPLKKCCSSCGSFLEGWAINNVTGESGYRTADGNFLVDGKELKHRQSNLSQNFKGIKNGNLQITGNSLLITGELIT